MWWWRMESVGRSIGRPTPTTRRIHPPPTNPTTNNNNSDRFRCQTYPPTKYTHKNKQTLQVEPLMAKYQWRVGLLAEFFPKVKFIYLLTYINTYIHVYIYV